MFRSSFHYYMGTQLWSVSSGQFQTSCAKYTICKYQRNHAKLSHIQLPSKIVRCGTIITCIALSICAAGKLYIAPDDVLIFMSL